MLVKAFCHIILLALLIFAQPAFAQPLQRYRCERIDIGNGLLQNNVVDLAFDQNNFAWISFANGIQKFDGRYCTPVKIQAGLPDDKWAHFFTCRNGNLFIAHANGISEYNIRNNRFALRFQNPAQMAKAPAFLGEANQVVYILTADAKVIGIDSRTGNIASSMQSSLPNLLNYQGVLFVTRNIAGGNTAVYCNKRLYLWNLQQQRLIAQSDELENVAAYLLYLKDSATVCYASYGTPNNLINAYDFKTKTSTKLAANESSPVAFRGNIFSWQGKQMLSWNNHLYETDSLLNRKAVIVDLNNEPCAGSAVIASWREDHYGNLYLVTINDGIRKLYKRKYSIRSYATHNGGNNYVVSILPDKARNNILMGTFGNGLLLFDTLQHLKKWIAHLPGDTNGFTANCIIRKPDGNYLLMVTGSHAMWQLNSQTFSLQPVPIISIVPPLEMGPGYFGNSIYVSATDAILQSQGRLYDINFANSAIQEKEFVTTSTMSGLYYNQQFLTHTNDTLRFYQPYSLQLLKKIPFYNTGEVRCFTAGPSGHVFIGSNKGIFEIDSTGNIIRQFNKNSGLPDECIYAMARDSDGNLWCSTNQGIVQLATNGSLLHIPERDGLQGSEFNTNSVATAADGELFFGGTKGANSFYPSAIKSQIEALKIVTTNISFNNQPLFADTAMWLINNIRLPYDHNALSFDFIAIGESNQRDYVYQYKMEGIDKEWIQTKELQTIHYLLQPGNYQLKVYAGLLYNSKASALSTIDIVIDPPFWKTWWFRCLLSLVIVAILYAVINQFNRRRFEKKIAAMESERKIQLERERISRDLHDNIGAYANAVIYNTELLLQESGIQEQQRLMEDLRFASKDIITSLRETIWALKKDEYTAKECLVRIRNFVQPFSRYYEHINFLIEGDAPDAQLHRTHALNAVRIVQEAVANAIKHSGGNSIHVLSTTEEHVWQLVVTDNGRGFDVNEKQSESEGNGLHNMQQRAAEAGFTFRLTSQVNQGTAVSILIPFDDA